jgi:hypothetical protein
MVLLQHGIQQHRPLRQAHAEALSLAFWAGVLAFGLGLGLSRVLLPNLSPTVIAAFVGGELLAGVLFQVSAAAVQVKVGLPAATRVRLLQTMCRFAVVLVLSLLGAFELPALAAALLGTYTTVGLVVYLWTARRLGLRILPVDSPARAFATACRTPVSWSPWPCRRTPTRSCWSASRTTRTPACTPRRTDSCSSASSPSAH